VRVAELIAANKQWIMGIGVTVAAIASIGAALVALGVAGQAAAFILGGVTTILSAVGAAFGLVTAAVGALLTPVGAVSAAVIILAGYLLKASGVGGEAIRWLGEKFAELRETAAKAFKGIGDALAAGDLALAGKILWLSLKVEWTKDVNALREIWTKFSATVVDKWKAAEQTLAEGIAYVIAKAEGLDPEDVIKNVRKDYGRQRRSRQEATASRLQEIETQRQGTLAVLEEDRRRAHAQRQARYGEELGQQEKELQGLIRQRDEAIAAAARAARETKSGGGPGGLRERIEDALASLDLAGISAGGTVAGTFSAFAAARFGGTTAADRTAKATEETAKNTRKLEERSRLNRGIPVV